MRRLLPSTGTTKSLSAISCKQIKQQLTTDCNAPVTNGLYWLHGMQVCSYICLEYTFMTMCIFTNCNRFIVTCQNWMVGDGH